MSTENRPSAAGPTRVRGFGPALRRHWWWLLGVWLFVSAGLMLLAYTTLRTNFEATAWLIVRPSGSRIFDQSGSRDDFGRFQKTAVDLVTSPDVLGDALSRHPEVAALPLLHGADDAEAEIRRLLKIQIRPDTNLITVSLSSEDKNEAVAIVDAVVEAYLKAATNWDNAESQEQISRLDEEARKLKVGIDAKKAKLRNLVASMGTFDLALLKDQGRVSIERFQNFLSNWDTARLRRIELEAELEPARLRAGRMVAKVTMMSAEQKAKIAFFTDPAVAEVVKLKNRAQEQLDEAIRLGKGPDDPARVAAERAVKELNDTIDNLWKIVEPAFKPHQSALHQFAEEQIDENDKVVQDLEARVVVAKNTENALYETLKAMKVENETMGSDALDVKFAQAELDKDEKLVMSIQNHIQQLVYDARGPRKIDKANQRTRVDPARSNRVAVMAIIPFATLAVVTLMLGTCALIGVKPEPAQASEEAAPQPPAESGS